MKLFNFFKLTNIFLSGILLLLFSSCREYGVIRYRFGNEVAVRRDRYSGVAQTCIFRGIANEVSPDSYFKFTYQRATDGYEAIIGFNKDTLVLIQPAAQFVVVGNDIKLKLITMDNLSYFKLVKNKEYRGFRSIFSTDKIE